MNANYEIKWTYRGNAQNYATYFNNNLQGNFLFYKYINLFIFYIDTGRIKRDKSYSQGFKNNKKKTQNTAINTPSIHSSPKMTLSNRKEDNKNSTSKQKKVLKRNRVELNREIVGSNMYSRINVETRSKYNKE